MQTKPSQTKHMLRRLAALGLCSAMLIGAVPVSVNAEDEETTVTEPTDTIEPTVTETPSQPQSQEITVKTASKSYEAKWVRKNKKSISCLNAYKWFHIQAKAKTSLSYKVLNGSKYVSVDRKGWVKLKKGTPTGTYKINVTAAATDEYAEAVKTVKITVKKAEAMLKGLNISWDLKNNKAVTYETNFAADSDYAGISSFYKKGKIKIKNYKVTNAKKKGYKKLTFSIEFKHPTKFSKKQVKSILTACSYCFGNYFYYTVVDYETGECLEVKNSKNVTSKGKWKYSGLEKSYGATSKWWVSYSKRSTATVTVIYPKSYKNLCILAGGESYCFGDFKNRTSKSFFKGKIAFAKATNLYASNKRKVCHGLRVK